MMNPAEYANIANAERDFWWYRGMEKILFALLDNCHVKERCARSGWKSAAVPVTWRRASNSITAGKCFRRIW